MGCANVSPKSVTRVSITLTSSSTRGRSSRRSNASRFQRSVSSSPAPPARNSYAEWVSRSRASASKSVRQTTPCKRLGSLEVVQAPVPQHERRGAVHGAFARRDGELPLAHVLAPALQRVVGDAVRDQDPLVALGDARREAGVDL